ncbi:hypothetical protein LEMLEM_LOCUS4462 [Lemmus lemmus]
MAPAKKGGEKKKGRSAINEVVTREYTTTFTSASMAWASRSVPLGRGGLQMCRLKPGSIKPSGPKE